MKTKSILFVTALLFVYQVKAQNVITVDNSVGANAQFNNLQTAITNASSGDIIYIHPSEFNYGNISINKALTLIGFGHSDPDKSTYIDDITLQQNASNSRFSGLNITGFFSVSGLTNPITGLVFENNKLEGIMYLRDGSVDNMIIRGNIMQGIGVNTSSVTRNNYTNTIISNNIFTGHIYLRFYQSVSIKNNIFLNRKEIVNLNSASGSITVQNNIFYDGSTSLNGYNPNSSGVIFENCLTYSINRTVTTLEGSNNLNNTDPLFVNDDNATFESEDDYNLQVGSPAMGSGTAGIDMGLYDGSPFVFNNFGYTNGIPTVKITNITERIAPGANLSVTINTNAN